MERVLDAEAPLVASLIEAPTPETLRELFVRRTAKWPHPVIEVEGGGLGLFSDLEQGIEPAQAWGLIPAALELALAQTDPDRLEVALSLLVGLARASDTTAQPELLETSWDSLLAHVQRVDDASGTCAFLHRELLRWYRVGD